MKFILLKSYLFSSQFYRIITVQSDTATAAHKFTSHDSGAREARGSWLSVEPSAPGTRSTNE